MTGPKATLLVAVCLALGHLTAGSSHDFIFGRLQQLVNNNNNNNNNNNEAAAAQGRILAGEAVTDQCVAPYNSIVNLIEIDASGDMKSHCTGTLLAPDVVLTAARCVNTFPPANLNQYYGVVGDRYQETVDVEEQRVGIAAIKFHPNYVNDPSNSENDENNIALVKLASSVTLGPCAEVMTRYEAATDTSCPNYKTTCRIAGWGSTHPSDPYENFARSSYLKSGRVNVMTDPGVVNIIMTTDYPAEALKAGVTMIAQPLPGEYVGTCRWDYGSMVACDDGTGQYVLRGVLSNHDKCIKNLLGPGAPGPFYPWSDPNRPMYVVDVELYKGWIDACIPADFTDAAACPGNVVVPA